MQKIIPNLWFDSEAENAAKLYTEVFANTKIVSTQVYPEAAEEVSGKKAGSVMTAEFSIDGFVIVGLNGGPIFKPNPSLSFIVNFDPASDKETEKRINEAWEKLIVGGKVLMPLDKYFFSERYGWVEDRFGVSWQLILTDPKGDERPFIVPSMMFVKEVAGRAEEAIDFYLSIFKKSKKGSVNRYPKGSEYDREGMLMYADFQLEGQWFAAMDSAHPDHKFSFNEGVSLIITCKDQEEIDYYWDKLTEGGEESQCGWLKDKFGFSWQVVPEGFDQMMQEPGMAEKGMAAFLKMKKIDIDELIKAAKE